MKLSVNFTKAAALGLLVAFGPGRALAQRALGIDVSDYQGSSINWTTVKSGGIVFAWSKATEGASGQYVSQASFPINESNGKAAGVYMGAYHFAHPEQNTPAAEASYFWGVAGSYILADGLTLMPMLDIEANAFDGHVGASSLSDWINQWCTDIVQDAANNGAAIKPIIYISACNVTYLDSSVTQWGSDIANYNGESAAERNPLVARPPALRCRSGDRAFGISGSTTTAAPSRGIRTCSTARQPRLASTMLATASTNSAIYYWDPQGTTGSNPYTGSMTGTWENNNWSYGSTGLATPVAWAEGKATCFGVHTGTNTTSHVGTPAYTVTMNSSHVVAGFFDGALAPNACDVTIQGSGIINLASGPQALDAHNASDGSFAYLRINCVIAGNGQLYPEGNGQSFLQRHQYLYRRNAIGLPRCSVQRHCQFQQRLRLWHRDDYAVELRHRRGAGARRNLGGDSHQSRDRRQRHHQQHRRQCRRPDL